MATERRAQWHPEIELCRLPSSAQFRTALVELFYVVASPDLP